MSYLPTQRPFPVLVPLDLLAEFIPVSTLSLKFSLPLDAGRLDVSAH